MLHKYSFHQHFMNINLEFFTSIFCFVWFSFSFQINSMRSHVSFLHFSCMCMRVSLLIHILFSAVPQCTHETIAKKCGIIFHNMHFGFIHIQCKKRSRRWRICGQMKIAGIVFSRFRTIDLYQFPELSPIIQMSFKYVVTWWIFSEGLK